VDKLFSSFDATERLSCNMRAETAIECEYRADIHWFVQFESANWLHQL